MIAHHSEGSVLVKQPSNKINGGWRYWEASHLHYHEPLLDSEWYRHTSVTAGYHATVALRETRVGHDIDPLASVHYADLKPLINSHIHQFVQIKWDVAVHDRDLYVLKALKPPNYFQCLTKVGEVVITHFQLAIPSPWSPISCPKDPRLLVTVVVRHWPLTTCSWGVQCQRKIVINVAQITPPPPITMLHPRP